MRAFVIYNIVALYSSGFPQYVKNLHTALLGNFKFILLRSLKHGSYPELTHQNAPSLAPVGEA